MLAPLGGIGVVTPVPDTHGDLPGPTQLSRLLEQGDLPEWSCACGLGSASLLRKPLRQRRICHV
jgi:hypothetical protein